MALWFASISSRKSDYKQPIRLIISPTPGLAPPPPFSKILGAKSLHSSTPYLPTYLPTSAMAVRLHLVLSLLLSERPYSLYVLLILMIVYLLNQLDRFVLGIAGRSLSRDLKFGSLNCFLNASELSNTTNVSTTCLTTCNGINSEREYVLYHNLTL